MPGATSFLRKTIILYTTFMQYSFTIAGKKKQQETREINVK